MSTHPYESPQGLRRPASLRLAIALTALAVVLVASFLVTNHWMWEYDRSVHQGSNFWVEITIVCLFFSYVNWVLLTVLIVECWSIMRRFRTDRAAVLFVWLLSGLCIHVSCIGVRLESYLFP